MVLWPEQLEYFTNERMRKRRGHFDVRDIAELQDTATASRPGFPFGVQLHSGKHYLFVAETDADRQRWIMVLRRLLRTMSMRDGDATSPKSAAGTPEPAKDSVARAASSTLDAGATATHRTGGAAQSAWGSAPNMALQADPFQEAVHTLAGARTEVALLRAISGLIDCVRAQGQVSTARRRALLVAAEQTHKALKASGAEAEWSETVVARYAELLKEVAVLRQMGAAAGSATADARSTPTAGMDTPALAAPASPSEAARSGSSAAAIPASRPDDDALPFDSVLSPGRPLEPRSCPIDSDYRLTRRLGAGAFSVVREGEHMRTGQRVAVKCIDKQKLSEEEAVALREEIAILAQVR